MKTKLLMLLLAVTLLIGLPTTVMAWDDCPRGTTCDYPGRCSRYVDTNQDGTCDRGQPAPVADLTRQVSETNIGTDTQLASPAMPDVTTASKEPLAASIDHLQDTSSANPNALGQHQNTQVYHLSQILLGLILLYVVTHVLSKKGIIRVVTHRKLWNISLLASFLISAVLGIILIIEINFGWQISMPFDALFWHVETGIAMGIIGIFHVIWHWNYFKKMVKSLTQAT